jgi:hypothetical protein
MVGQAALANAGENYMGIFSCCAANIPVEIDRLSLVSFSREKLVKMTFLGMIEAVYT